MVPWPRGATCTSGASRPRRHAVEGRLLSEGLGSSLRCDQTLWPWSHSEPSVLPACGADALPMTVTVDFMSLDSALARPGAPPRAMKGAAPLAAPQRPRLLGPRSAQETVQVRRSSGGLAMTRGNSRNDRAHPLFEPWAVRCGSDASSQHAGSHGASWLNPTEAWGASSGSARLLAAA